MTHDQEYSVAALRDLLEGVNPEARLIDSQARTLTGEDTYEVVVAGTHYADVGIRDNGRIRLMRSNDVKEGLDG